ncbi:hypothetical protein RSAG8_03631, partial [Rhizoctonia solani AG-8 WAC10335]
MSKTTQHEPPKSSIVTSIAYSTATQWVVILTLIFGGCCSNALALEYTASYNPHAGSLITFTQFLLVAAVGLRHRLYAAPIQTRNSHPRQFDGDKRLVIRNENINYARRPHLILSI